MSNLRLTSKTFALLACLALLLAPLGCNMGKVTSPDPAPVRIVTDPNIVRILSTPKDNPQPFLSSGTSKHVSAEFGGVVTNGRVTLEFPPGALNSDTKITIDMPQPDLFIVELGPDGLHFNKPVTMTFDFTGTNAEGLADYTETLWFNETMGWWEPIPEMPSDNPNEAKALLEHFSHYSSTIAE